MDSRRLRWPTDQIETWSIIMFIAKDVSHNVSLCGYHQFAGRPGPLLSPIPFAWPTWLYAHGWGCIQSRRPRWYRSQIVGFLIFWSNVMRIRRLRTSAMADFKQPQRIDNDSGQRLLYRFILLNEVLPIWRQIADISVDSVSFMCESKKAKCLSSFTLDERFFTVMGIFSR